jgi:hypothetical protein
MRSKPKRNPKGAGRKAGALPTRERPSWAQVTALIESGTADGAALLALLRKARRL